MSDERRKLPDLLGVFEPLVLGFTSILPPRRNSTCCFAPTHLYRAFKTFLELGNLFSVFHGLCCYPMPDGVKLSLGGSQSHLLFLEGAEGENSPLPTHLHNLLKGLILRLAQADRVGRQTFEAGDRDPSFPLTSSTVPDRKMG